jgi:plastocyanin
MRRSIIAGLVLPILLGGVASAGPTPPVHVAVDDFAFLPASKMVPVSTNINIVWDNGGDFTHTATSNGGLGFIDTGDIAPGASGQTYLYGSGTYRYHCAYHSSMTGEIKVRPTTSDASFAVGGSATITYGNPYSKGVTWDLQRRRNGGEWVTVRSFSLKSTLVFTPTREGTYDFRARTRDFSGDTSAWSPYRRVWVTAA